MTDKRRKQAPSGAASGGGGETLRKLEEAARHAGEERYVLRLYVTGATPTSTRAIERVRSVCEAHLHGRYELEVFDIFQMPQLAKDHQIVATPTLVKLLPAPLRRYIGDLSKVEKILFGLDLRPGRS
jgi:circadian clock protein KaiB